MYDNNNALHLCKKSFWYSVNAEEFTYLGMFIFYQRGDIVVGLGYTVDKGCLKKSHREQYSAVILFNMAANDSPTEHIITLRITSEHITSERINTERITS